MELADSGNGNYEFEGVRHWLVEALQDSDSHWTDEYGEWVFIKPPSGYEVEMDAEIVKIALGVS